MQIADFQYEQPNQVFRGANGDIQYDYHEEEKKMPAENELNRNSNNSYYPMIPNANGVASNKRV